jgi:hypothetical protein
MTTINSMPDPALVALAALQLSHARQFYATSPLALQQWTWTLRGETPARSITIEKAFDASRRASFYRVVRRKLNLLDVERYAVASEAWEGGADNPNRKEVFAIVCADKNGQTILYMYDIARDQNGRASLTLKTEDVNTGRGELFELLDSKSAW